jgi:hypothetical protein
MQHPMISEPTGGGVAGMPRGPWLLVVGMHRSGTSAVTGALGALGFHTPHPDDRWGWHPTNPDHWESIALNRFDGGVLADMGGSWDAPPDPPAVGATGSDDPFPGALAGAVDAANVAFREEGPLVWKDPRVCLLLPEWRRVLPAPLAAVLVWRSPLAVARSVHQRDRGMGLGTGVALWERYNRSALEHLAGVDTYVCRYEAVLEDPVTNFTALADWLATLPQFAALAAGWNPEDAAATITELPSDRTRTKAGTGTGQETESDDGSRLLLAQHHELVDRLTELEGGHRPLGRSELMDESGWTTALLASRRGTRTRELDRLEGERRGLEAELESTRLTLERLRGSTTWRITRPLRALSSGIGTRLRG